MQTPPTLTRFQLEIQRASRLTQALRREPRSRETLQALTQSVQKANQLIDQLAGKHQIL